MYSRLCENGGNPGNYRHSGPSPDQTFNELQTHSTMTNTLSITRSTRSVDNSPIKSKSLPVRMALVLCAAFAITACSSDDDNSTTSDTGVETTTRASGMRVSVQSADGVTVHTLTAPEAAFANSTHLIETENSLVAFDTQFLLPNAQDMRDYATEIGKPIDRLFITHEHPDHFLGSEVFNDLPIFALQEVSDAIAANGDAEVAEKQADFGTDMIASTFVVPQVVGEGNIEIDSVTFSLEKVLDAEAENQLVVRLPNHGVILAGDIVYSGVHLIMAGTADSWITALQNLAATGDQYPIVLPGHGVPAGPAVYDTNIQWLTTFNQLLGTVDNADDFRQGLIDAFPNLGMAAAIDFVTPILFPAAPEVVTQAVNFFDSPAVTSGMPQTVAVSGPATIGDEVEFPGFAFGVYDVDATASQVTMTLATDPNALQVANYDNDTKDFYYYAFDIPVATARISGATEGFAANVQILPAGATATAGGTLVPGLATSFSFENGGILVTIGNGTNLTSVGQGGSLTIDLTF